MKLFGKKKEKQEKKASDTASEDSKVITSAGKLAKQSRSSASEESSSVENVSRIVGKRELLLLHPRITEKATSLSECGVYAFDIHPGATKREVAKAVEKVYKVRPVKIHIVKVPARKVFGRGGKKGMKSGGKKAYVYLQTGDTIEFV